jgi:alpha-methylacyl-CoA racemase
MSLRSSSSRGAGWSEKLCAAGAEVSMSAAGGGPLTGLRVIELAGIGPGPFCAMLLADLGAEVLRIDRPGPADSSSARAQLLNRGRRSVIIDLKRKAGADLLLSLAEQADVLIEGMRPGVLERLGVGPDECLRRNPRLVYGRMTGWGQDGPLAKTAGHDVDYIARTGALHMIGRSGGPPQIPLNLVGDFGGGGLLLAFGICSALWERSRSGQGQVVDAAIVDGVALLLAQAWGAVAAGQWRDERGVNRLDTGYPWYDVYQTNDDRWIAIGPLEPKFWAEFTAILDVPQLPDRADPQAREQLRGLIAARIRERTRAEWEMAFDGTDACVAPVLSMAEAPGDKQLAARQTFTRHLGATQPAPAPRFSRTAAALGEPPPVPGEHSRLALRDWGVDDIDALIADGIVAEAAAAPGGQAADTVPGDDAAPGSS